jgi:hypothetical protein
VNNKLFDPYTVKTGTDSQLLQKPSVQMYWYVKSHWHCK